MIILASRKPKNKIIMSSTFKIHQDICVGCGTCEDETGGLIALNDEGVAYFPSSGKDTANFGDMDVSPIFAAIDACPCNCIEEIG